MNRDNLKQVFSNYISKFEYINNPTHDESFKWEVVQLFQDEFDIDAEDFADMLYGIWKGSYVLIDNSTQQPFYGLICFAREEPETVRQMFRTLYEDDGGDLKVRQAKIRGFIDECQQLLDRYYPGSWKYVNDQRTVMTYLFLYDPSHNYLYKYTQATKFADCVEFYDDWGSGAGFKLDVYYRMCDELVKAIKDNQELISTNASRFEVADRRLYPDTDLHTLAFDIIYCCAVYDLYQGISYQKPDMKVKRLSAERREKAAQLYAEVTAAAERVEALKQAKEYFVPLFTVGTVVKHKAFGTGKVISADDECIEISFRQPIGTKRLVFLSSIAKGFLTLDKPSFEEKREQFKTVMEYPRQIQEAWEQSNKRFAPYAEYLDT